MICIMIVKENFKLHKLFYENIFFKMMKKTVNELEAIYLSLKDFYDEKLVLHEKNCKD